MEGVVEGVDGLTVTEHVPHKLVVIGIDGSPQCEHAFNFYVENLHQGNNRLLLIHCAEPPVFPASHGMYLNGELWQQMLDKEKETIQKLENKFAEIMKAKGIGGKIKALFSNNPGEIIVETANEQKASMIVMGTRGLGTIRRTVLGSVSDYVVHHAHCPVVVCRQ